MLISMNLWFLVSGEKSYYIKSWHKILHFLTFLLLIVIHDSEHCNGILIILIIFQSLNKFQEFLSILTLGKDIEYIISSLILFRHFIDPKDFETDITFVNTFEMQMRIFIKWLLPGQSVWLNCWCTLARSWQKVLYFADVSLPDAHPVS